MAILSETAIAVFGNRTRLHTKKINKKKLSPTYLPKFFFTCYRKQRFFFRPYRLWRRENLYTSICPSNHEQCMNNTKYIQKFELLNIFAFIIKLL